MDDEREAVGRGLQSAVAPVSCLAGDVVIGRGMATEPHNKLLAGAAREVLRPLGVHQIGRSRTWIDDHGWWVGLVEFQPSSWAKGSYLNVGVTWLWRPDDKPTFFFAVSHRVEDFREYESEEQFSSEARQLASVAGERVAYFRDRLTTPADAGRLLELQARGERYASWTAWDAAVALGLSGGHHVASEWFLRVAASTDDRAWWLPVKRRAERWAELVTDDPASFIDEVRALIDHNRAALKLPPEHPRLGQL